MKKFKLIFASVVALSLSACGGGGGGDDSSNGGSVSPDTFVSGDFKSRVIQDLNLFAFSNGMDTCRDDGSDRYFESEDTIVFGSESLPASDFQYAATMVHNQFGVAISKMGLSQAGYEALKGNLSSYGITTLEDTLMGNNTLSNQSDIDSMKTENSFGYDFLSQRLTDQEIIDLSTAEDLHQYVSVEILKLSNDEKDALKSGLDAFLLDKHGFLIPPTEGELSLVTNKVIVCLDPNRTDIGWGQGSEEGISIGAHSTSPRSDDQQIVLHELIHHLQITIAGKVAGRGVLERWFSEGQAVALSGMRMTQGDHARPTINVTGDNQGTYYSDMSLAYEDYGQAYQYIVDNFGNDKVMALLQAIRVNYKDPMGGWSDYPRFRAEFTNTITDIEQLRLDYPTLAK
ncbi:MAG: hypothetical protein ACJAS1_003451 [Oleiphilaceae bacterium]|jgi:hypothetical protein